MALSWREVAQKPEFADLSAEDKWRAREDYFAEVVAPHVPEDQISSVKQEFYQDTDPYLLSRFESGVGQFVQGATGVLSSIPKGVGEAAVGVANMFGDNPVLGNPEGLRPEDTTAYQIGQGIDEAVSGAFPTNPAYSDEILASKVPQAFGSTGGFLASGLLGRALGGKATPITAFTGAAAGGSEFTQDYVARHQGEYNPDDRFATFLMGLLGGATEAVPIGNAISRMDKAVGGSFTKHLLTQGAKGAIEEGAQEGFQQLTKDLTAKNLVAYDPERNLFEDTPESAAIGGGVGFVMNVLLSAIGGKPRVAETAEPSAAEPQVIPGTSATIRGEIGQPQQEQETPFGLPRTPQAGSEDANAIEPSEYQYDNVTFSNGVSLPRVAVEGEIKRLMEAGEQAKAKAFQNVLDGASYAQPIRQDFSTEPKQIEDLRPKGKLGANVRHPDKVVFPDGSVASRQEVETEIARLEKLGDHGKEAAFRMRAQLLGYSRQQADAPRSPEITSEDRGEGYDYTQAIDAENPVEMAQMNETYFRNQPKAEGGIRHVVEEKVAQAPDTAMSGAFAAALKDTKKQAQLNWATVGNEIASETKQDNRLARARKAQKAKPGNGPIAPALAPAVSPGAPQGAVRPPLFPPSAAPVEPAASPQPEVISSMAEGDSISKMSSAEIQKLIDEKEDVLESSGINPAKLFDKNNQKAADTLVKEGWRPRPDDLQALYDARDAVDQKDLSQSINEIQKSKPASVSDNEFSAVLKEAYSLSPGDIYSASTHTLRASRDIKTLGKINSVLLRERGFLDEQSIESLPQLKIVSKPGEPIAIRPSKGAFSAYDEKTLADAAQIYDSLREKFHGKAKDGGMVDALRRGMSAGSKLKRTNRKGESNAKQITETSQDNASGLPQQDLFKESKNTSRRGVRVREGGQKQKEAVAEKETDGVEKPKKLTQDESDHLFGKDKEKTEKAPVVEKKKSEFKEEFAEFNDSDLSRVEIDAIAVDPASGKKTKTKENAAEAIERVTKQRDFARRLLECLKS